MINDSITEEFRSIRRELAAQFGNEVSRIFADVRRREASDGRLYVTPPKRHAVFEIAEQGGQLDSQSEGVHDETRSSSADSPIAGKLP